MKVPNYENANVSRQKIVNYLLSFTHRDGRAKAQFFSKFGFVAENWEAMAEALKQHVAVHHILRIEPSPFGTRYIIEGELECPDGRTPRVRSVWFIAAGEEGPHFVTADPRARR
jgi:hypothetical protein